MPTHSRKRGGKARWSLHEQLGGDISQIRRLNRGGEHPAALARVDAVIDQAPEFADAWLLKARILRQGFNDEPGAKKCLQKVMALTPDPNTSLYLLASELYRHIVEHVKRGAYARAASKRSAPPHRS